MERIQLDHGAGGRASRQLVEGLFARHLGNELLDQADDACLLPPLTGRLAISTDTFVVDPLFFPGGDIGDLAVNGTVNDVAMRGARPLYLTVGFILEEGLELTTLERVVVSLAAAAKRAGVLVVAGDTKVVGKGQADKLYINTTGLGLVPEGLTIGADRLRPGDAILVSGTVGDHGLTIMAQRQGLGMEAGLKSDTIALNHLVADLLAACPGVRALRDPTRGGLATTLVEWAGQSRVGLELDEDAIPLSDGVRGLAELLGLDPYYLANEGKLICAVDPTQATAALAALRARPEGAQAAIIGRASDQHPGRVWLNTRVGGQRLLDMLSGEPLPRIC